jgi:hypothetical protein
MRQVFKHISKDSPKNASKVVLEIAEAVLKAKPNPETRINIRPTMMGASGLLRNTDTGLLNGSPKIQSEFDKFTAAKHRLSKDFQQNTMIPAGSQVALFAKRQHTYGGCFFCTRLVMSREKRFVPQTPPTAFVLDEQSFNKD